MTRTKDEGLADSQVEDLKARVELIDKESPALAVCIHQNSYPQEKRKEDHRFLFAHSKEAKKAAEVMQTELKISIRSMPERLREILHTIC